MSTQYVHIGCLTANELVYLDDCARDRNISRTRLVSRLMKVIAEDKLVLSVLDDSDAPRTYTFEKRSRANRRFSAIGG